MSISTENKSKLDNRLAIGEITLDEYNSIIAVTSQQSASDHHHLNQSTINDNILIVSHFVFVVLLIWYSVDMGDVSIKSIIGLLFFKIAAYINIVIYVIPTIAIAFLVKKTKPHTNNIAKVALVWASTLLSVVIVGTTTDGPFTLNIPDTLIGEFIVLAALVSYLSTCMILSTNSPKE
jgi:hypothetical protein